MPKVRKVHGLFEKQVKLDPDKIAIFDLDHHLTYGELDKQASQLARFLLHRGVRPGDIIPLFLEKTIESLVALLAVLKTGSTFFLLNSEQLGNFVCTLLDKLHAKHVISQTVLLPYLSDYSGFIIDLTNLPKIVQTFPQSGPPMVAGYHYGYAYGVLTSGSTGDPKCVMVTHQNLLATYDSWHTVYQLSPADSHLQMAPMGFDVFVGDWIRALGSGAQLVLCPKEYLLQPSKLYDAMTSYRVSCAEFVPATLRSLLCFLE